MSTQDKPLTDEVVVEKPVRSGFRRYQWIILLSAMFCYLFYYTGRQTFGFAIPGITAEFGITNATAGLISGALLWAYAAGQFINGNLADKFGGRYTMSIGAVLSTALNWIVSLSVGPWMVGIFWALNGYAQALGWSGGSNVISKWWPTSERGKAFGFYTFAAGMASVLAFVTSTLIVGVWELDWRWIFRLPVLLMLVGGVAFFLLARNKPEDVGYDSPHDEEARREEGAPDSSLVESRVGLREETSRERYKAVLKIPGVWIGGLSIGFLNAARYGLLVWVPVHFLGSGDSVWISVMLPVGMAAGALSNGYVSDRFFGSNRSKAISTYLFIGMLAALGMYLIPSNFELLGVVALFFTGFLVYGPQSSFWALCPDLGGAARAGTTIGIMNTGAYVIAGFSEPLVGYVIDVTGQTSLVFLIVAAFCLISALISLAIRR